MDLFDAIIVGSGPAGTLSAYALQGSARVLVLDVGNRPPLTPRLTGNLYELRQKRGDLFEELIGTDYESLRNLHQRKISLKLKSPRMSYIVRDWEKLCPIRSNNFEGAMSFAQGGLANAWGAGVYRFDDRDLREFPVKSADLRPYYDEVSNHIGISGENHDDLAPYFGEEPHLQPPIRITSLAAELLEKVQKHSDTFRKAGIGIGRSRLAVLTEPHNQRRAYTYDNLEFYQPLNPAVYNPVFTLDDLVAKGLVELERGWLVLRYREVDDHVEVTARHVESGEERKFHAKRLLLAAGTLSTTRIVLESNRDFETRLPILDNWMACLPLFRLNRVGAPLDVNDSALAQLNLIYESPDGELLQGSIYGTTGPLRTDILFDLPLSVSANVKWTKYLAPAMILLMLFGPGHADAANGLRLTPDGELDIDYRRPPVNAAVRKIIQAFRKIGYLGTSALCQYPAMGSSLHYAGTLPMKQQPGRYQTHADGLLYGTRNVYVTDGACFTDLPAKNLTFTIMANAMRIARRIASRMKAGLA
jgi:choline dehydrogenase-like flavoprotein